MRLVVVSLELAANYCKFNLLLNLIFGEPDLRLLLNALLSFRRLMFVSTHTGKKKWTLQQIVMFHLEMLVTIFTFWPIRYLQTSKIFFELIYRGC